MLGGILLASLVAAAVCVYIRRSRDRGSSNIETRNETATEMLQTNEEEDNEYDYMFDRTDNWDYFIMVRFCTFIYLATDIIIPTFRTGLQMLCTTPTMIASHHFQN